MTTHEDRLKQAHLNGDEVRVKNEPRWVGRISTWNRYYPTAGLVTDFVDEIEVVAEDGVRTFWTDDMNNLEIVMRPPPPTKPESKPELPRAIPKDSPLYSSGADAAAASAEFTARSTYAFGYDAGVRSMEKKLSAEVAGREVAEQRVCELRASLAAIAAPEVDGATTPATLWMERKALAALSSTADIAGRWVSVRGVIDALTKAGLALGVHSTEGPALGALRHTQTQLDEAVRQRDAAIARAERAEAERDSAILADWHKRGDVIAAERARDEVGIQYAAAQERLRLFEAFFEEATAYPRRPQKYAAARRALDTVPGDALPPTSPAGASVQPSGLRAIALSHLEASGIDTSNVKEKA